MTQQQTETQSNAFVEAAQEKDEGMLRQLIGYLLANKKWWLLPIVLALLTVGLLLLAGGGAAAPFIYTLF